MRRLRSLLPLFLLPVVLLAGGCASENIDSVQQSNRSTNCQQNHAVLLVTDAYISNLCGCQETSGSFATPPAALTCTVSAGTTVFFLYNGTQLPHQISSRGTPVFASSPPRLPGDLRPVTQHAITLSQPGSYGFIDLYNSGLNGTIQVN